MKTGKHQKEAARGSSRLPQTALLLTAALALVLLIVFLPRLGERVPSATEQPISRGFPEDAEIVELLPLEDYDVEFALDKGRLSVSGSGAMPALERSFSEEELAAIDGLSLAEGITALDADAFRGCARLKALELPESLVSIGAGAFADCRLETITIPAQVTEIAEGAFRGCTSLKEIRVDPGNPAYVSVDGVLFSADRSLLLCYPGGKSANGCRVPEGVTRIAADAFCGFQLQGTLFLPASLTELGEDALSRCFGLSAIKTADGCPAFSAADGVLYDKDRRVLLRYPSGKTSQRFSLPRSVTEIAPGAFRENYELTELTLPEGLVLIGREAFSGCSFLRSVKLPRGLVSIGDRAFFSCGRLPGITLPDSLEDLGEQAFAYCYELAALSLPSRLQRIGAEAFLRCDALTELVLPDGFSSLGPGMFRQCGSLASVTLPASLSSIGAEAFADCAALKTLRYAGTRAQWDAVLVEPGALPADLEPEILG